ncbi:Transmembrane protein 11, mitochondrial [Tyrophagus putrescentiae]|nr:Transmembrane protein 11, mitochondrial [Tyrophagus putrescentiae]
MADDAPYIEYGSDLVIIREIFDGAHELFENELEHALDIGCPLIIIEPMRLGEETGRWIYVGECLARASIVTGLGSVACGLFADRPVAQFSLLAASLAANTVHALSWQSDICSSYAVDRSPDAWARLLATKQLPPFSDNVSLVTSTEYLNTMTNPAAAATASAAEKGSLAKVSPVILRRRSDRQLRRANWLKAAVSLIALAVSVFRLFKSSLVGGSLSTSLAKFAVF